MSSDSTTDSKEKNVIPTEFNKIIKDLSNDLRTTFPEYAHFIDKWWQNTKYENPVQYLYEFCLKKMPPRFFDILYKNADMFSENSDLDTEFLPNIHFRNLWQCEISDNTRETIWRYLQLILFAIVGTMDNSDAFGETIKMFKSVEENDLKNTLEETMSKMYEFFENNKSASTGEGEDGNNEDKDNAGENGEGINMNNFPSAENLHEHINGMLGGKLGELAMEIAQETASDLNLGADGDLNSESNVKDVFQKLMKNPTKLMSLVKNVGSKLDEKIKSGSIKESELMSEASDIINRMKDMPGMGDIQSMLKKMGMSKGMGGGKFDFNAMESKLNQNMKQAQMKEKMREKAEIKKAQAQQAQAQAQAHMQERAQNFNPITDEQLINMFSNQASSSSSSNPNNTSSNGEKKKKKKKKN
uniref:Uncharacterized protein n=1 Tax=viral metagenome TaxID=1070528 RepID=A0A6C0EDW6_9ZZZZ